MPDRRCRTVTTRTLDYEYQAYCAVCGWLSGTYPWQAAAEAFARGHEQGHDGAQLPEPADPWIRGPGGREP